jgi:hypothetical protein
MSTRPRKVQATLVHGARPGTCLFDPAKGELLSFLASAALS